MIIDSFEVNRVESPASTDELAEVIRSHAGNFTPVGSGAALAFGNPLNPIDSAIDTRRLARITEYTPADLTVHVEAGIRLGDLQNALAAHNQMIPLDPWNGRERTLGGIVATNAQGPLRGVGSARDWIIGMRVVHADGRVSRTGGRVVKNVSGYDLAKLYMGSVGSLAVISEISFKVSPRWGRTATARVRTHTAAAASEMVRRIRSSPLQPISFVWSGPDNWIHVRFGDTDDAVEWQLEHLPVGDWERLEPDAETEAWQDVSRHYEMLGETVVRAVIPPSGIGAALHRFAPAAWLAHAATGPVLMAIGQDQIAELRREFPAILERAPLEVRRRVPTFGVCGAQRQLMLQIKNALDPSRRLNPGRHVDGET